jgi:RHS repeat-associated protein
MSDFPAAAAAPTVRLSQLSHTGIGDIAESLNLFRGDVNLPLPLVSLRGRNGLDVALTAFCVSNVDAAVQPSNRVAPTGVLGVGWNLPRDQVVLADRLSGSADGAVYLQTGGALRQLVRSDSSEDSEFELTDYQFWSIRHHRDELSPDEDYWEVVREDGSRYVYGRAGIEWGVRWGNWSGPSAAPGGERFPVAWNLVTVTSPQGDTLRFSYDRDEVPIGGPGRPAYTRACYLAEITDPVGRRVELHYRDKEPFEAEPPHPVPPGGAQVFQDTYETRYLDQVTVTSQDDARLLTLSLHYGFDDVSASGPADRASYRKRYLTSVTEAGSAGLSSPPLTIGYWSDSLAVNPGAVRELTYPRGAVVSYDYAAQSLPNAATSRPVPSPGRGYVPRVWHGPGYVVVTWHSVLAGEVQVQAYTWNGTWNGWTDAKAWSVAPGSLNVQAAAGFYVVSFTDARTGEYRIRLYRRSPYRSGEWELEPYQVDLPAGENAPLVRLGRDFAAIADRGTREILIVSRDPVSGQWSEHRFSGLGADRLSLAVTADACVAGCYDSAAGTLRFALQHRTADERWVRSAVLDERAEIDWQFTSPDALLGAGENFVAASFVTSVDENTELVRYGLRLLTWDSDHAFGPLLRRDYSQPVSLLNPIGVSAVSGATAAVAQHLFRFDGRQWQSGELVRPAEGRSYGYAHGSDVAVAAVTGPDGAVSYHRASYDPYSGDWHTAPITPVPASWPAAALPSVSGDVLLAGREAFRRSPTLSWEPLLTVPRSTDPVTVLNRAPFYLAWQDEASSSAWLVALDADGLPRPVHRLDGESYYVPDAGPGQVLAGVETLVTYRGPDLDTSASLRLHRIVGGQLETELTARSVVRATVADGYESVLVSVEYDRDTATYDPYGLVAQYVRARLYRGDPRTAPGYVESVFFNGLRPDVPGVSYPDSSQYTNAREFFAKLNGQLFIQTAVDAAGRPVSRVRYDLFTYDRANSGYRCRGSLTRRRRAESAQSLHLFDADPAFAARLDARALPPELREQLTRAGFGPAERATVTIGQAGRRWTIAGPGGPEVTAVLEDGHLALFSWITDVSESDYNGKGQLSRVRNRNVDSTGQVSDQLTVTTFGWEVYPGLAARHIYDLAAEVRTVDTRTGEIIERSVSTYRDDWPSAPGVWVPSETYRWTGAADSVDFSFPGWPGWSGYGQPGQHQPGQHQPGQHQPGQHQPGLGWVRTNKVLAVTGRGLVRSAADIGGNVGGIIYDRTGWFPVATTALADPAADEAAWYGFEEYEDAAGWELTPAGTDPASYITAGDAFAGRRRLSIPGDPGRRIGFRRTFAPAHADQPFLLSCWLKTFPGFVTDPEQAGWQVTIGGGRPAVTPIGDTGGRWQFFHLLVTGAKDGDEITVEIFSRQDRRPLLVDAICFAPSHGRTRATVYDPADLSPEADLDQTGLARRYCYNRLREPVLTVSDDDPTDSTADYRWRAQRPGARFDPADPDASFGLAARAAGAFGNFRHGDEWTADWEASAGWRIENGELRYDGSAGTGTLARRESSRRGDYALRVAFGSGPDPATTVGFAFGDVFTALWSAGQWQLRDRAGTMIEQTAAPVPGADDLTLSVAGASMLLAAGGQLVLSHTFGDRLTGAAEFRVGGPLSVAWIAMLGDPVSQVSYTDNAGQVRQVQSVGDGEILVSAWCYDSQGRPEVETKTARLAGGPGYRPGFTAALDPATGQMTGCELTEAFPADGGYPFSRIVFERSPLARAIERSAPGSELAIDPRVAREDRHTTRVVLGLNLADPDFGLPAGQYRATGVLDPDGVLTTRLTDRTGAVVATRSGQGEVQVRSQLTYDGRGNPREVRQPNYFDPTLPERHRYVTTMEYDAAGRLVRLSTPDLDGAIRSVFDRAGRPRFVLMPQEAADGQFSYRRYDRLGRLVEQGTCRAAWDETELRAHADDRDWLPAAANWQLRYHFDGDDDARADLSLAGRLWRTEAADSNGGVTSTTFSYDQAGLVSSSVLRLAGGPDGDRDGYQDRAIGYRYNLAGDLITLEYAADPVRVDYRFDRYGRVAGLAVTDQHNGRQDLAAYTYEADGAIRAETLRPASVSPLVRSYRYTSAGWLREIADQHLVEQTEFFSGGVGGAGSHTGRAARITSRFTGVDDPLFLAEHRYEYRYDPLGRLLRAVAAPDQADSIGDTTPVRYDQNGNVLALQRGSQRERYLYYPGGNRLRRVAADGDSGQSADNEFNADGDLSVQPGGEARTLSYDPVTGRPVRIDTRHGASYRYRYDAAGRRVLKSGPDGSRYYLPDATGRPVLTEVTGQPPDYLIYGPLGLAAVHRDGITQHVLLGRLGSTRAIWDGSRLVAAYNYRPFGDLIAPAYRQPAAADLPYLFTGQELDAETGLYNLGARLYDPATGRMVSIDPAGQYPSPYLYAGADPVNLFDPTGEFSWSWGAFAAVLGGVAALIGGIIVSVATGGAATPAVVALGALAGGALIGAGVASAAYGFAHADADTSQFDWAKWGVTIGLGAGFGALTAGLSLAFAPAASVLGSVARETLLGGVLGIADSLTTTVALNHLAGQDLATGWQTALWTGALGGAVGGAIASPLGWSGNLRTARTRKAGVGSGQRLHIVDYKQRYKWGHIYAGGEDAVQPWLTDLTHQGIRLELGRNPGLIAPARHARSFEVPSGNYVAAGLYSMNSALPPFPAYNTLWNSCTTYAKEVLRSANIYPPPWTVNPRMLGIWASQLR